MKRKVRPSPALVIACAALFVALSGVGYAAVKLPANSVGTRHVINGSLLALDFKRGQIPAPPILLSAAVTSDGRLFNSAGALSAQRLSPGAYRVTFNRPVQACFYQATIITSDAYMVTARMLAEQAVVAVHVFNRARGAPDDAGFYLAVFCKS